MTAPLGAAATAQQRGVAVNGPLQSVSNPAVYAGGDAAASGPPLTAKADRDAGILATNLLQGNRHAVNYDGLASAVFTIPPLASAEFTHAGDRRHGADGLVRAGARRASSPPASSELRSS